MRHIFIFLILIASSAYTYADEFDDFDKFDKDESEQGQEHYEASIDIDHDGVIDIEIHSEPQFTFGNSGGGFNVLYRKKDGTSKRTKVFGHPMAFSIETLYENARAWVYTRSNSEVGYLTVYDLTTGLDEKITIHPKEPLGDKLYRAVFSKDLSVEFTLAK